MNQQGQNFSNQTQEPKHTTPRLVLYVILLFIIPPVGLYLLWQNKDCHKWFPHLLLTSGGYWLILTIALLGQFIPTLSRMIQELGIETRAFSSFLYAFVIVFVLQIISGFLIDKKINFTFLTPKNYSMIAIIFLCIDFLVFPIAFALTSSLTIQKSLYEKLGELDSGPKETVIDKTANWKTYQNKDYGYEIKYPGDWKLDASYGRVVTLTPQFLEKQFKIEILNERRYTTLKDEAILPKTPTVCLTGTCVEPTFLKDTEIRLNNYDGIERQIAYSDLGGLVEIGTYILKGGSIFILELRYWEIAEIRSEDLDFYNQMLSTFRFLE